jgi:hypothetical protein
MSQSGYDSECVGVYYYTILRHKNTTCMISNCAESMSCSELSFVLGVSNPHHYGYACDLSHFFLCLKSRFTQCFSRYIETDGETTWQTFLEPL